MLVSLLIKKRREISRIWTISLHNLNNGNKAMNHSKVMKYLITIFIFFYSCSPAKKSERLFHKAIETDKQTALSMISQYAKVETRYVRDTIKEKEYIKQSEQLAIRIDTFLTTIREVDTSDVTMLRKKLNESYEYIDGLQDIMSNIPILVDTIYQKDENSLWLCNYNYDILNKDLLKEKSKRVRDLWILVLAILLCAILITIISFRK